MQNDYSKLILIGFFHPLNIQEFNHYLFCPCNHPAMVITSAAKLSLKTASIVLKGSFAVTINFYLIIVTVPDIRPNPFFR
jgi:hypothetical protein